jgi:GrpB-like predicted nucleotidyltransferase (UPF0157 family)
VPVVVVDYEPGWPERFDALRRLLVETLGDAAVAVEHIGSTAVPGLAARPIIDIDVALADYSSAHELRPALEAAGFRRILAGDFLDRQWYVRDEAGKGTCHLSLTYLESETWLSHRALRDRLLADPEGRQEYGQLKKRLAAEHSDPEAYTEAKTDVIQRLAGFGWRKTPPRRPLISRRLLLVGGLALLALVGGTVGVAYYSETSRGSDGLPDHRPVRAADLASRPEAKLFYPGSTVIQSARSDQSSDPNNPATAPAKIDTLLASAASADVLQAWYGQRLPAAGWRAAPAGVAGTAGEVDLEWRRGSREFFDLRLYLDRAALGSLGDGVQGFLYRVEYLVGTGH